MNKPTTVEILTAVLGLDSSNYLRIEKVDHLNRKLSYSYLDGGNVVKCITFEDLEKKMLFHITTTLKEITWVLTLTIQTTKMRHY